MATVKNVMLVLSQAAEEACTKYGIDVETVARDAVRTEIKNRAATEETVLNCNPDVRNERLRTELLQTQEALARAIEGGEPDWQKFL